VGYCIAVGEVTFSASDSIPFIVVESAGVWGAPDDAIPTPGTVAGLLGVSCTSRVNCVAIGWFESASSSSAGFEDVETAGVWQPPVILAPTPSGSGFAQPTAVTCVASSCVVVGDYEDPYSASYPASGGYEQTETDGVFGPLRILTRGLNQFTQLTAVSCAGAITACVAVGGTTDNSSQGVERPISVLERGGSWAHATELPVFAPAANDAELDGVACESNGACIATGILYLTTGGLHDAGNLPGRAIQYSLVNSAWSVADVLPLAAIKGASGYNAGLTAVFCGGSTCWGAGFEGSADGSAYPLVVGLTSSGRPSAPARPSELYATRSASRLNVFWAQPVGSGGVRISSYSIAVSESGVGVLHCGTKRTTCSLPVMKPGKKLVISVRARNVAGIYGPAATLVVPTR
jgi:hypothetical protein